MTALIPTQRAEFLSRGIRCAAWLTLPATDGPHPAVVLVHGLGATHDMMLAQYEQHFAAAGIATLAFDYRNTGKSEGEPRQHIWLPNQRDDVHAALAYLSARPEVDTARLGLWGTSLGGMNVVRVAAARTDVSVAVVQCSARSCTDLAPRDGLGCRVRCASRRQSSRMRCGLSPGGAAVTCRSSDRPVATRWSRLRGRRRDGTPRWPPVQRSTTGSRRPTPSRWWSPRRCGMRTASPHLCSCACAIERI